MQKAEFLNTYLKGLPFEEEYAAAIERFEAGRLKQQIAQQLRDFQQNLARNQRRRHCF
jgi:hypothetical protein